jgi:ABC-type sugar transport system substrate-binding protein
MKMGAKSTVLRCSLAVACAGGAVGVAVATSASANAKTARPASSFVIGSVINDLSNPFLSTMGKAEQAAGAKAGVTVHVVSGSSSGTISISTQISEIQQFVSQKVNAILVTPSDPKAIVPAIKLANQAGIPVFAVNSTVGSGAKTVTFVGDNDYQYGVQEAKLVAQAIHGKGDVALLEGVLGDSPEVLRTNAIEATLKKYPKIKIVTKMVDAWTNPQNITDVQNLLSKYGKTGLAAVVAEGPEMYAGAELARSKGDTSTKFIAGDYSKQVQQAIEKGALYGTVDQSPATEGQMGVQYALDYLKGQKSKIKTPQAYIPLPLITKANVHKINATWSS